MGSPSGSSSGSSRRQGHGRDRGSRRGRDRDRSRSSYDSLRRPRPQRRDRQDMTSFENDRRRCSCGERETRSDRDDRNRRDRHHDKGRRSSSRGSECRRNSRYERPIEKREFRSSSLSKIYDSPNPSISGVGNVVSGSSSSRDSPKLSISGIDSVGSDCSRNSFDLASSNSFDLASSNSIGNVDTPRQFGRTPKIPKQSSDSPGTEGSSEDHERLSSNKQIQRRMLQLSNEPGIDGPRPPTKPFKSLPKNPWFNIYLGIPEKDDSKIVVDEVLTDKRFNFWNLPSSAKVLLVSGIPRRIYNPDMIFNLFGCYGNVNRVRMMRGHKDKAIVEFQTATGAMIARNNLDQVEIEESKLFVRFSRYGFVRIEEVDLAKGMAKDYSDPSFEGLKRFPEDNEPRKSRNLNRLDAPKKNLVVTNFGNLEPFRIRDLLEKNVGLSGFEYCGIRNRSDHLIIDQVDDVDMNRRIVVTFKSESEAAIAMSYINGYKLLDARIKVHFSKLSCSEEKELVKTFKDQLSSVAKDMPFP